MNIRRNINGARYIKHAGAMGRKTRLFLDSGLHHRLNQMGVVCLLDNKLRLYLACGRSTMNVGGSNGNGNMGSSHPPLVGTRHGRRQELLPRR